MTDEDLFGDTGPESRNLRGEAFEDQLVKMGATLGWEMVCRNADMYLKGGTQQRGIDVLWSVWNQRTEEFDGWIEEAKCHELQAPSAIRGEVQTLHDKLSKFADSEKRKTHPHVGAKVKDVAGGILAHRSQDYDPEKTRDALLGLELRNKERGRSPLRVLYFGPDTLEAIADAFQREGAPVQFFWPPTSQHAGGWADSCPPDQLAAGLLAYRTPDKVVLWLRDTLGSLDVSALDDILKAWGIDPDVLVCAELDRNAYRKVAAQWDASVEHTQHRAGGKVPKRVEWRNLSYGRLARFDDLWPPDAA